jgi:hypothetical protein
MGVFLALALVGGKWSASRLGRITPEKRAADSHCVGDWVSLKANLDDMERRKFLKLPGLELRTLGHPARSQSL